MILQSLLLHLLENRLLQGQHLAQSPLSQTLSLQIPSLTVWLV